MTGADEFTDEFTKYETGLKRLLEKLGKEHPRYIDALVLEARLRHDIKQARLYPNDAASKTAWMRTLKSLNQLALETLGISFNELCTEDSSPPPVGDTARIRSCEFKAVVVAVVVVLLVIAVGLCSTVGWLVVELWAAVWLLAPPAPQTIPQGPEITVKPGGTTAIYASTKGVDRYEWTLTGPGQISSSEGSVIFYTAPDEPGVTTLSVSAHNRRGASLPTSLTINVVCSRKANAAGTSSPAIAISSIIFVVNGVEQAVNDSGPLSASSGDQVQVKEVTICVSPFAGKGGQFYVAFDPVNTVREIIESEATGTQTVAVDTGFETIPGPAYTWTIGDNWRHISVMTVHYPAGGDPEDPECEKGACEIDDRIIVNW